MATTVRPWVLLGLALTGACSGSESESVPPQAEPGPTFLRPHYVLEGVALAGNDSLPLDGASSVSLAGDLLAILHAGEGRVILIDLARRTYRLLGRSGDGPGDVPRRSPSRHRIAVSEDGTIAILDAARQTLRVWDSAGRVLWYRNIGSRAWGPGGGVLGRGAGIWWEGVGLDSHGRAYVPLAMWDGDSVSITILRVGPGSGDSGQVPLMATDGPVRIPLSGGRMGMHYVPNEFVRRLGTVFWSVADDGLIYAARSDRSRIDTVRTGGGAGSWLLEAEVADQEVPEDVVARRLRGNSIGGRAIRPAHAGPLRYAVLQGILVAGRDVWIARSPGTVGLEYDVVDRATRATKRVALPGLASAASDRWAVAWTTGVDGVLQLRITDLDAPPPPPGVQVPLLTLRQLDAGDPLTDPPQTPVTAGAPGRTVQDPLQPRLHFAMGCTTLGTRAEGVLVEVVLDSTTIGTGMLRLDLHPQAPTEGVRAVLTADNGASSTCYGNGRLRFSLSGQLPATLTLAVSAAGASVQVIRVGAPSDRPVPLRAGDPETVRLTGIR